jgi:hypothetical protein
MCRYRPQNSYFEQSKSDNQGFRRCRRGISPKTEYTKKFTIASKKYRKTITSAFNECSNTERKKNPGDTVVVFAIHLMNHQNVFPRCSAFVLYRPRYNTALGTNHTLKST